jgi:hypothetical protein
MSLSNKDFELQEAFDYLRTFTDQEYEWPNLPDMPHKLSDKDAYFEDSSYRCIYEN